MMKKYLLTVIYLLFFVGAILGQTRPHISDIRGRHYATAAEFGCAPGGNIRTAITAAIASGVTHLQLNSGNYTFSGGAISLSPYFTLSGSGNTTVACVGDVFALSGSDSTYLSKIENIIFVGDGTGTFYDSSIGGGYSVFDRVTINGFDIGVKHTAGYQLFFNNCVITYCRVGADIVRANETVFNQTGVEYNSEIGLRLGGNSWIITGCQLASNTLAIESYASTAGRVIGNYFEENKTHIKSSYSNDALKIDSNTFTLNLASDTILDLQNSVYDAATTFQNNVVSVFAASATYLFLTDSGFIDELHESNTIIKINASASTPINSTAEVYYTAIGRENITVNRGASNIFTARGFVPATDNFNLLLRGIEFDVKVESVAPAGDLIITQTADNFAGWVDVKTASGSAQYYVDGTVASDVIYLIDGDSASFTVGLTSAANTINLNRGGDGSFYLRNYYPTFIPIFMKAYSR